MLKMREYLLKICVIQREKLVFSYGYIKSMIVMMGQSLNRPSHSNFKFPTGGGHSAKLPDASVMHRTWAKEGRLRC